MCLPKRFKALRLILVRNGLKTITPNEILGEVMTEDQYNDDSDKKDKKEKEKKKEKTVAFKATTSKSAKGKSKKEETSDDEDASDIDDEQMALFVRKFGKFMKKNRCSGRKRRDNFKSKEYVKRCYKCKSTDHMIVDCPNHSDNDEKKKEKA